MRNKIIEWVLGILFFASLIGCVGFVEEAPAVSVLCAMLIAAIGWAMSGLWTEDEEDLYDLDR